MEDHLCVFADAVSLARSGHTPAAPDETKTHSLPLFLTPRIHMTDWRFLMSIRTHPKSEDDRAKTCMSEPRMHAGPDMVKRSPASSFPSEIKSDDALLVMWPVGLVSWTSWTGVPGVMTTADANAAVARTENLKKCVIAGGVCWSESDVDLSR